ncbi:MucB/RseB C-terminal domain-containing protein [Alcanivorax quisquiliarum]|uniref:MucB/RseB C-terminal domain-containing protein n=1 Tax=Alcanivorax quisquiliarum TaxID=2933565 RepID=A0ABT0E7G2_9GAMM|nr:MucB/RseB C-terminal domain-containing protein [Alcanivorax quisquiliarum]
MPVLCILPHLVLAQPAPAEPVMSPPQSLLAAMASAYRNLDYQGRFLYTYGNELSTLEIRHAVIEGVEYERLTHLSGPVAELIRADDQVICVHSDRSMTRLSASTALAPLGISGPMAGQLPRQYNVLLDGDGRVAGRAALRMRVNPLDEHRYGYRLWIDRDSNLLLKSEMVDAKGVALERLEFLALDVGTQVARSDFDVPGAVLRHAIEPLPEPAPKPPQLEAGWLPAGFVAVQGDLRRSAPHRLPVAATAYGDGLASFTLFLQPIPAGVPAEEGVSRLGPTVAISRRMAAGNNENYLVTLVGEVPQATAERVLSEMRLPGTAVGATLH